MKIEKIILKKTGFILFVIFIAFSNYAKTYYVNPNGNDNNSGQSIIVAFRTLNHAGYQLQAGDTLLVMNGTYYGNVGDNVLTMYNSGRADAWITVKNYPGHSPVIRVYENYGGIAVYGPSYIHIEGFKIVGSKDSITYEYALSEKDNTSNLKTTHSGIGVYPRDNSDGSKMNPKHIIIKNCDISKCSGGGIAINGSDYVQILNNTVYECAFYSPWGTSGISIYQSWNSDANTGYKNFIIGNTCYKNENFIPFFLFGAISDGNGIIIDDNRNTQFNSTAGAYTGRTYIANNLLYDNGGRAVNIFESDNVTVINNTCYRNVRTPSHQNEGEFNVYEGDNIEFINNIVSPSTSIKPINIALGNNIAIRNNLWTQNSSLANPLGDNTVTGNSNFINPGIDPSTADFRLQANSPAIDAGTNTNITDTDKDGNLRKAGANVDLGCYEYKKTIVNGEFDNGITNWRLELNNNTSGTMTESTTAAMSGVNSLRVCPASAGDADWNVQVIQSMGVLVGKTYEISYMAKADAPRTMTVVMQQAATPYTSHFSEGVSLTTSNQSFTHTFTATSTDASSLFRFFVGNNQTCVNIDKVVVNEVVPIVTGLEIYSESTMLQASAYPNPFTSFTTLRLPEGKNVVEIFTINGSLISKTETTSQALLLGEELRAGVYIIKVNNSHVRIIKN